jgi:hypothetical protein
VNSHIAAYGFLTLCFLTPSSSAQNVPATNALRTEVHISVYDDANVPAELLAAAEVQVRRIFQQAGVETLWGNCSQRAESTQPVGCHVVGSTYLMLRILPHAMGAQVRDRNDVLGTATLDEKKWVTTGMPFMTGFSKWRKRGDSRLHFWAMYSHMKSAICSCGRIRIRSAGSCPQDGLVKNCGDFRKESCFLRPMNPR